MQRGFDWKKQVVSVLCIGAMFSSTIGLAGCGGKNTVSTDKGADSVNGSDTAGTGSTLDDCGHELAKFTDHKINLGADTVFPSTCYDIFQYGGSSQPFATGKPCDLVWANLGPSFNYNNNGTLTLCTYMELVQVNGTAGQCLDTQGRYPGAGQVYRRCHGDDPNYFGVNVSGATGFSNFLIQQAAAAAPTLDMSRQSCRGAINTSTMSFNDAEAQYNAMVTAFKSIPQDLAIQGMRSLLSYLSGEGGPLDKASGAILDVVWTAFVNMIADAVRSTSQFKSEHADGQATTFLNVLYSSLERSAHHTIEHLIEKQLPIFPESVASMTADFISQVFTKNLEQTVDSAMESEGESEAGEDAQATWLSNWVANQNKTILDSAVDTAINGLGSAIDKVFPGGGAVINVELKLLKREVYALAAYGKFFAVNQAANSNCNAYTGAWNQANQVAYQEAAQACIDMAARYVTPRTPIDCTTEAAYCGDTKCNNGETCSTCADDCGACPSSSPAPSDSPGTENCPGPDPSASASPSPTTALSITSATDQSGNPLTSITLGASPTAVVLHGTGLDIINDTVSFNGVVFSGATSQTTGDSSALTVYFPASASATGGWCGSASFSVSDRSGQRATSPGQFTVNNCSATNPSASPSPSPTNTLSITSVTDQSGNPLTSITLGASPTAVVLHGTGLDIINDTVSFNGVVFSGATSQTTGDSSALTVYFPASASASGGWCSSASLIVSDTSGHTATSPSFSVSCPATAPSNSPSPSP